MRSIRLAFCLFSALAFEETRAGAPPEANQLEKNVRAIIGERCGSCHDGALPTADPAALKIFDLRNANWTAGMSDDQLRNVLRRNPSKSKPLSADQKNQLERFIKGKLEERANATSP